MPLSWNQIRANASKFSEEWKEAHYERGQSQTFYNEFFEVFGQRRRDVGVYERKVKLISNNTGFIDLFWPGTLIVEQKSAGRDLKSASGQADDYILALKQRERPRYKLVSDFQSFELSDLENGKEWKFSLSELPEKIKLFGFIAGYHQEIYKDQDPVNIDASEKMSNLHKLLEDDGYKGKDLELLLVRVMFCLFADDTGIFQPDIFLRYIEDRTEDDGSDLGGKLVELFQILDTPNTERQKSLDEDLSVFPYVNGQLFERSIRTPSFDKAMRQALLECCYFDWSKVSPALFGSLFQTVMLPAEQRQKGAHYTSEKNILKTIYPLFMDDLNADFEKIKDDKSTQRQSKLNQLHEKLSTLTFFDPACGCGNFLILAYRELRELELKLLQEIHRGQRVLDISDFSKVDVDQFYGIEIEEFPARIAEVALWLVDHQMNMRMSEVFGQAFVRLPLNKAPHIVDGNALRLDWANVLEPSRCSYILGNPPFIGHHLQTKEQKEELNAVLSDIQASGVMDYVSAWFMKASQYIQGTRVKVAFVSTNSITQGEQVGILWSVLFNRYNTRIHFAHRTFKWTIDGQRARGMRIAAVYVVIIGFAAYDSQNKILFDYETITSDPHKTEVSNINSYLVDAPNVFITNRSRPLSNVPDMKYGSKPTDDGNFLFTDEQRTEFLRQEPNAEPLIRPFISAREYLNGQRRWCLWLVGVEPAVINRLPLVRARVEAVRQFRAKSDAASTRNYPHSYLFRQVTQPNNDYILVPRTTSENRSYIPMGFFTSESIVSDTCQAIPEASLYHFGVLTSQMHMAWMRYVCGRLKGDYRYSKDIVYNNFPWPNSTAEQRSAIEDAASTILHARANHPQSSLADMYGNLMPVDLKQAHIALDRAVDKAYRRSPFIDEKERVAYLFVMYQSLMSPLGLPLPEAERPVRRRRARN